MRKELELKIDTRDRRKIREDLVAAFLCEEPGTGKGENCSHYKYFVDITESGNRIFLKRPARLNKGFDFEVHVENFNFSKSGRERSMPSHSDLTQDIITKAAAQPQDYVILKAIIDKAYRCEEIEEESIKELKFGAGMPVDVLVKSIKWLFIEQDITYWNWSGRDKLYKHICALCL